MAKTLKDFLEGYLKVKSADEQKFIDKHVTAKNPDRNGNGDDVFKGSTKTIDRRKERKGYNPGEDEKVYEGYHVMRNGQSISYHQDKESADKRARTSNMRGGSNATVVKDDRSVKEELKGSQHKIDANKNGKVDAHDFKLLRGKKKKVAEEAEELEELSTNTLRNYRAKAKDDAEKISFDDDGAERRMRKRSMGSWDAGKKILKRGDALRKEEVEELEEMDKSPEANPYSGWGHRKGDDYAGKPGNDHAGTGKLRTTKQTTKDAARVLDKAFKGRGVKEEVEELEELSKKTLGSYVIKSLAPSSEKSISNLASKGGYKLGQAHDDDYTAGEKEDAKSVKRSLGVLTAVRKMTKEQSELEEKLTAKTPMGKYIKDFTKSDAPQFAGKSASKRRVMAIAAKLTAERGGKPFNKEERLQDRLSDISESHQRVMLEVFGKLNEDNKTKFMTACATPEGVEQMLDFAITYRGE
jgi:hypothetical protein